MPPTPAAIFAFAFEDDYAITPPLRILPPPAPLSPAASSIINIFRFQLLIFSLRRQAAARLDATPPSIFLPPDADAIDGYADITPRPPLLLIFTIMRAQSARHARCRAHGVVMPGCRALCAAAPLLLLIVTSLFLSFSVFLRQLITPIFFTIASAAAIFAAFRGGWLTLLPRYAFDYFR
jgi:hypothetical protein